MKFSKNYRSAAALGFLLLNLSSHSFATTHPFCDGIFTDQIINQPLNKALKGPAGLMADDLNHLNRLSASWEISRHGVNELMADVYGLDNVFYYTLTALMAKENILIDGPGGGAKTLGIRNIFEAQLRAVHGAPARADIDAFKMELLKTIWEDKVNNDPLKQIFTQQFHATLSETKILGGPDPFKFTEQGRYEIDYSKALISDKNLFAILDEVEKAPVALQMTLLSILNERQALAGNKVVQTALESLAGTTNATLGEMISQALPHEIGGRRALIDRFALKVHVINASENADSLFLMLEKIESKKGQNKFTVIDVRGLRPLMKQVKIPDQMLAAMTTLSLHMDRYYTDKLAKAQADVQGTQSAPDYFPPFSGSTRTQSKLLVLWKSSFLVRQMMAGVPFESLNLTMGPKDLVDLSPALLQGGPDTMVADKGVKVSFYQVNSNGAFSIPLSNSKNKKLSSLNLSRGEYNKDLQMLTYVSARTGQKRHVKFDIKSGKLLTLDPDVREEIGFSTENLLMDTDHPMYQKYGDLNKTLGQIHLGQLKSAKHDVPLNYKLTGRMNELLNGNESTLREASRKQLTTIDESHAEFLAASNTMMAQLKNTKMTLTTREAYDRSEQYYENRARRANALLSESIKRNDKEKIEDASAVSLRNAFDELKYRFLESESNVKALFSAMMNRTNVMLFGPPGSAKTLLTRTLLEAEVKNLNEAQLAATNSILSKALLENGKSDSPIWIKQFHPMSNEGDIVGRIDLKAIRDGKGYVYNRTGSLSSKDVLFALLDEFEKAPAGVKTSLLSLLNERQLLDGDEIIASNLIAVVIATNSTPGEFVTGLGDFSTAFPIFDRIQTKAYSLNKLTPDSLSEFHRRMNLGVDVKLKSPLFIYPLTELAKSYSLERQELKLLSQIHQSFLSETVKRSEAERKMHNAEPTSFPDFYMNTRGESNRSAISTILKEFKGTVLLNKILSGTSPRAIRQSGNRFDPTDLVALSELYLGFNGVYRITHDYNSEGMIFYKVVEKDMGSLMDRIDSREKKTLEDLKFEADEMVNVLNKNMSQFMKEQRSLIQANPTLYPGLFASTSQRQLWISTSH
jgi:MoxR-like ATPase